MMFLVSFGVLVFCRSLRENRGLKVKIAKKLKSSRRAIKCIVPRSSARLHRRRINGVPSMFELTLCAIECTQADLATPKP
jgi:hypothetical protein